MRRFLVALLCAILLVGSLSSVTAAVVEEGTWAPSPIDVLPEDRSEWWPDDARLTGAREAAFDWLEDQQATDGTWSEDYGVTGLVAFAMLNGGRDVD
ncbi:MAG: hypothetical protein KAQ96_00185, partial [Thermoplasmata archaeon]|nr:hypothetical protein [Thermoplasmata archaeon]